MLVWWFALAELIALTSSVTAPPGLTVGLTARLNMAGARRSSRHSSHGRNRRRSCTRLDGCPRRQRDRSQERRPDLSCFMENAPAVKQGG